MCKDVRHALVIGCKVGTCSHCLILPYNDQILIKWDVLLLVQGKWTGSTSGETIVDPLNGEPFIQVAEVDETGIQV